MFRIQYLLLLIFVSSCGDSNNPTPNPPDSLMIKACDLSSLPEIESKNITFYNASHQVDNMLNILKSNGMNTVRIRLWHTPINAHSGFEEVKQLVQRVHQNGLKVWLTVHYSDTWADPGHQSTPNAWQALSFPILKDSVFSIHQKNCPSNATRIHPNW
jgi:arabinogalactan endo-1,4-beta-galactosidase